MTGGVAELRYLWAGQGGAMLALTSHGALLERPGAAERFEVRGRHADGAAAVELAERRGYEPVGLEDASGYEPLISEALEEEADVPSQGIGRREQRAREALRLYEEISERVDRGETVRVASREVAARNSRSPGGLEASYYQWRKGHPVTNGHVPPVVRGVAAVAGDDGADEAIGSVAGLQDDLRRALLTTWEAIPQARALIERRIEELMAKLDDLDAEGKRVRAAADAMGLELPDP